METIYKKVGSITFGLLSPELAKKMAAVKIVTPELYDKEGYSVDGGLMDTHMGVIDPGLRCRTCGGRLKECPGHFGYVELARPIVHIKYVKPILDILRSTCRECSRILVSDQEKPALLEELNKIEKEYGFGARRKKINDVMKSLRNIKKCPHCSGKQYTIKIDKPSSFYERDKRLTPVELRVKLEKIPDDDLILVGLNPRHARPEWMVLNILAIAPVTIRPSITLETGERSEDDLTHKLGDIVRINQRLFENINAGAPEIIIEDLWDLLQYHVTTYFDNDIAQVPPARHRSGQPLKTLSERIKSKEGRFRHNLAGKRVDFAARTVISPDPESDFNEVGIPKTVAMELTVPERVTEWNKEWLKTLIKNGPDVYPGANYIVTGDGKKKRITEETKEQLLEEVEEGYKIERHLQYGDIAIFNRQPSLHRMSIMCHKVRVLSGKSFRLNPSVCVPYNADFDGDEMNLHIPQNEEAMAEADILMQVQTQIMSPKHGRNIIGCIEDAISGNYLLTKYLTLTREETIQLLISIGVTDFSRLKDKQKYMGKEIFSVLLPKDFTFAAEARNNTKVIIEKGELVEGIIDDNTLGDETGTLIREVYATYGQETTLDFIGKVFRLGIKVLLKYGFTTGIADTDVSENVRDRIHKLLLDAERKVEDYIQDYKNKKLEILPGKTLKETLEIRILELLNRVRNKIGDLVAEDAAEDNSTVIMAKSGAKGNLLNLAQMAACVGQQALSGQRIKKGYSGRTLSLFKKGDLSPAARGFVRGGFKDGLEPHEFFFHAMTGRDALMDTALRTPKSGYLYRRLANALQDLKVEYDGTVRDAHKRIIQFKYGEDGIDVSKSDGGTIDIMKIINKVKGVR
ncbi:MAG: DNA-directed RNA polymerase subunit A' [Candidatus Woesearchaeota archaeon]